MTDKPPEYFKVGEVALHYDPNSQWHNEDVTVLSELVYKSGLCDERDCEAEMPKWCYQVDIKHIFDCYVDPQYLRKKYPPADEDFQEAMKKLTNKNRMEA